jgi:glycosyltransferase involved in cell wall biosynthesis
MLLGRSLSRGACYLTDLSGKTASIGIGSLIRAAAAFLRDGLSSRALVGRATEQISMLEKSQGVGHANRDGAPLYLRSDHWFGIRSGGSVGHVAGVVNELDQATGLRPVLVTTDVLPGIETTVEVHVLDPVRRYWDYPELPELAYNELLIARVLDLAKSRTFGFIYQRYSLHNYSGVAAARELGCPLVIEYNGSEIWMSRQWGARLRRAVLARRIEDLVLQGADLVVVVSEPMRAELLGRGVADERILVNPNGVDTERYSPTVDGSGVRERLGLADRLVVGFIGTFGPWHGAEVLADAFGLVMSDQVDRDRLRLLMIGDGVRLGATRMRIEAAGAASETVFAGRTDQADGPAHLAACDILVSPHVPNADGTPFFGSPTKLFEYMAMGRPIVASRLDQIGEVLVDEETALLVPPGDVDALASAIARLIADSELRARLGAAARARAVEAHTWRAHTRRILDALEARVGPPADA